MSVTQREIHQAIERLGLAGQPVCVHASLRSFGRVEGGAQTILHAFRQAGCTLLVPSFSWDFAVPPPPALQFPRNGWDYGACAGSTAGIGRIYHPTTDEIDRDMGALAATVVATPGRVRGHHPICSFTAVGPLANDLIAAQQREDVYAPLVTLAQLAGSVLLMGVGLDSLTLLHLAEKVAGRTAFRRWANDPTGHPMAVEAGGCSDGFPRLAPMLQPLIQTTTVGASTWLLLPAEQTITVAAAAIRADPAITHCANPECERCNDAVAGGPILPSAPAA
jgi:aminoglycoside N3'-acetyltransferase